MKSGLIIGEFTALNQGHVQMIDFALSKVEKLYVYLFNYAASLPNDITRGEWERNFSKSLGVHLSFSASVSAEVFLANFHCPADISILFSTDKPMRQIAKKLKLSFWLMENYQSEGASFIGQNGTEPFKHWHQIPREIRQFFVKKVVLFGPESTGKSTLASQLAYHFQTVWNPEYIRTYLDIKQQIHGPLGAEDDIVKSEDLEPIAIGQLISEKDKVLQANKLVFFDTNLFMHSLYVKHYFEEVPSWLQQLVESQRYDLYLLLDTDIGYHPDPYREGVSIQKEMHKFFRRSLEENSLPYFEVSGKGEKRLQNAIEKVKQFFNLS